MQQDPPCELKGERLAEEKYYSEEELQPRRDLGDLRANFPMLRGNGLNWIQLHKESVCSCNCVLTA